MTISIPHRSVVGFPRDIVVAPGTMERVDFPTGLMNDIDMRVLSDQDSDRGIRVVSTNGAQVNIIGVNDERVSADAFLALPCKTFNSDDGRYRTNSYKYFVFSSGSVSNTFRSRFLIVPCAETGITYRLPGGSLENMDNLQPFRTYLFESTGDLTSTTIESSQPLAVFVGHECGVVPIGESACDHLVEQVPPTLPSGPRSSSCPLPCASPGSTLGSAVWWTATK